MMWLFTVISLALACDEFAIRCDVTCKQDGDQRGVVISKDCYCANKRDLKKVVLKFRSNQ